MAASRRTTPQPAAQPARTKRTTRSQSHDISDGGESRRGGRQTLSDGAESPASQSILKGKRGRSVNQSRALQDLSILAEEPSIAYPELQTNTKDEEEEEQPIEIGETNQQANVQSKSPGAVSAFSGTTARTSRSAQDLSDLSTEVMLDAFLDLSRASDKMLNFLMPTEISRASITAHMAQLQTKRSPANLNLTRLATTLSANRDMYGSESYIALPEVLGTLVGSGQGSNDNAGPWRPDTLLQKANLAVLASSVFSRSWRTQDAQLVEELEHIFPLPFTVGFLASETTLAGYSELLNETSQLALDIRTQYAIMLLARHARQPNLDPNAILLQVFYEDAKTLRGWGVGGLRAEDLTGKVRDTILSRLEKVREAFAKSEEDFVTNIELLQSSFPWTTLVLQVVSWINLRLKELNRQISEHHGADRVFEALKEEVQRARLAKSSTNDHDANDTGSPRIILEYDLPSDLAETAIEPQDLPRKATKTAMLELGQFSANSPKAVAAATFVKRFEANRKASLAPGELSRQQNQHPTSDIQVTATAGPSSRALEPQSSTDESVVPSNAPAKILNRREPQPQPRRAQEEDDGLVLIEPEKRVRQVASHVYVMRAQRQAESNKENIEIPMSQPEPPPGSGRKRRLIDPQPNAQRLDFDESQELNRNNQASQIEDLSEDGGFQYQHVAADITQRRHLGPALERSAPQPERPQRPSPKKARILEVDRSGKLGVARDRINDEPSPSPIDEYRAANSSARDIKAFQPKPPQTRKPWSDEETETLLTLIENHGTSWALLLEVDKSENMVLQSRGQVALKDKARNMKMDYLKSSNMLPVNFERVPISKIQIDTLTSLSIQYDHETGRRVDAFVDIDDD